jgi:hypothetical protein
MEYTAVHETEMFPVNAKMIGEVSTVMVCEPLSTAFKDPNQTHQTQFARRTLRAKVSLFRVVLL